jgi:hypothetical protein
MNMWLLVLGFAALIIGVGLLRVTQLTARYAATIRPSTIAAARGVVEISGHARAAEGARTRDPNGVPCIWHRVVIESADGEQLEIEGGPPADPAAVDTILLDDGTGLCSFVVGNTRGFFEREVKKLAGGQCRVILRIKDGTKLFAVGRVERLAQRERGATHRIEWDRSLHVAYSNRSLATMGKDVPRMWKISIGLVLLGAAMVTGALLLIFVWQR